MLICVIGLTSDGQSCSVTPKAGPSMVAVVGLVVGDVAVAVAVAVAVVVVTSPSGKLVVVVVGDGAVGAPKPGQPAAPHSARQYVAAPAAFSQA